jgi:hypothetical protein
MRVIQIGNYKERKDRNWDGFELVEVGVKPREKWRDVRDVNVRRAARGLERFQSSKKQKVAGVGESKEESVIIYWVLTMRVYQLSGTEVGLQSFGSHTPDFSGCSWIYSMSQRFSLTMAQIAVVEISELS